MNYIICTTVDEKFPSVMNLGHDWLKDYTEVYGFPNVMNLCLDWLKDCTEATLNSPKCVKLTNRNLTWENDIPLYLL